jgi:glycosyltransferase involved in cell wall biosynthesis
LNTLAILVTAYSTENYILNSIHSLKNQKLPDGWKIQFYIGVDACQKTAAVLNNANIPYFFSKINVGTYILTNSLIKKSLEDGCSMFLRFDSDDIATRNFLTNGITHCLEKNLVRNFFINLSDINKKAKLNKSYGSIFFTKKIIEELGGYHHYRVSCDKFFVERAERLGYQTIVKQKKPVYYYRIRKNSLTNEKSTSLNSSFRKHIESTLQNELNLNYIYVDPKTTDLTPNINV